MKKLIPLACFLIASGLTFAQIPKINLSQQHILAIEQEKNPVKKLKLYRKYFHKDSVKTVKKYEARLKRKSDSLSRVMQNLSASENKLKQKAGFLNRFGLGKLTSKIPSVPATGNLNPAALNSATHVLDKDLQTSTNIQKPKEVSALENEAGLYNKQLSQYDTGHLKKLQNSDSLKNLAQTQAGEKIEKKAESEAMTFMGGGEFQKYQKQMALMKSQQAEYLNQSKQLTDSAAMKKKAKEQSEKLAQKYISEHPELMKAVQKKMNSLMRKYSSVPNSNDLSTAVKRTSLKGKTFRERLVIATNFQVMNLRPVSVDFSPQIGYKFNSRFVVGVGGTYRQTFKDTIPHFAPQVFGYKGFSSYDVFRSFFAYTEFDRNSTGIRRINETKSVRLWQNNWLLGAGKRMRVNSKIDMTVTVLYNVFHKPYDPVYPRPFMVRVGFQLSELAMLKRKMVTN